MSVFSRYDLPTVLAKANHQATLSEQIVWLENFFIALRKLKVSRNLEGTPPQVLQIKKLFEILDSNPVVKTELSKTLQRILKETTCLRLFSQVGLLRESGFVSEASDRLVNKFLPVPLHDQDFADPFALIFNKPEDAHWIEKIDHETFLSLIDLLNYESAAPVFTSLRQSMRESLLVLGTHVAELGLSRDIRERMKQNGVMDSPFLNLSNTIGYYVLTLGQLEPKVQEILELHDSCLAEVTLCRQGIREVFSHLEERGVSITIVYRLENLMQCLARIEWLMKLLQISEVDPAASEFILKFVSVLVRDQQAQTTIKGLVQDNLRLISRKIVERAGATGEHYITRSKGEYLKMLIAGAGGGVITAFTTIAKYVVSGLQLPLFFEGFFQFLNYSGSFVLMQLCHFTLATKQPSMTGPALAMKLSGIDRSENLKAFVDEVVQIMRSQFAAIVGNVGFVIPSAFILEYYYRQAKGVSIISPEYAEKALLMLHPLLSLTIPYAAFTGILLWLSSIYSGWLENWFVYRKISEAITFNRRLNRYLGKSICRAVANWLSRNVAAFGGNVGIGFLLAATPVIGSFFGLPLDVRHVTLSSGLLTLSAASLYASGKLSAAPLAFAMIGILIIGFLNVFVSFLLALSVAMRARNIRLRWMWILIKAVAVRFRQSPISFFWVKAEGSRDF